MNMSDCVMAFDLGTSSLKGIVMNEQAEILASVKRAIRPAFPQPDWAESDPASWWHAACDIAKELTGMLPQLRITAVAFNAPACGIIPMTKETNLYPSLIWLDNRADPIARGLMASMGADPDSEEIMGQTLTGKDCIPKLLWLKEYRGDLWSGMDCFLDDTGYLVWRATGRLCCTHQCACFICYDYEAKDWDWGLLDAVGLDREKFPPLLHDTDIAGALTDTAAAELGLDAGIPVFGGFSDNQAVELGGTGAVPGETMVYIGTSTLLTRTERDVYYESSRHANFLKSANPDCHILFATNDTSGGCIDWMIDQLFDDETCPKDALYARVDDMLDRTEPGANGLLFTTWFHGERNPVNNVNIRATFLNFTENHTRAHIARAVYEGICYQVRWTLDSIRDTYGLSHDKIRLIGGGARSERLVQILSDVLNLAIEVPEDADRSVAKGTGMLALIGLGLMSFEECASKIRIKRVFRPRPENRAVYDKAYREYVAAYYALKGLYKNINQGG